MAKKIFIWVGHPRETSLSHGLADAYQKAAEAKGAEIRRINLRDMQFDMHDFGGYSSKHVLEPDLVAWQEAVTWCDHTFWVYPYWWAGMPAKMKSVLDRAMLPGFGFAYREKGSLWNKLLTGRTGDAIITSDTPPIFDTLIYRKPGRRAIKNQVFSFTGIKPRKIKQIGAIKPASEKKIQGWIEMAGNLGASAAAT